MNNKLYNAKPPVDGTGKLTVPNSEKLKGSPPTVSITYLDKKRGFKQMHKDCGGDYRKFSELDDFFERVRSYKTVDELNANHHSHIKAKNDDAESRRKLKEIQEKYNVETGAMTHLHLGLNGKKEFVLHGFFAGGCFHIVWMDPFHDVHKSK